MKSSERYVRAPEVDSYLDELMDDMQIVEPTMQGGSEGASLRK